MACIIRQNVGKKNQIFFKIKKYITPIKPEFQWTVILVVHFFFSQQDRATFQFPFLGHSQKEN